MGHTARSIGRRCCRVALSLATLAVLRPAVIYAEDMTWDNGAGNLLWSATWPANWEGDALPGAADRVIFGDVGVGIIGLAGESHTIDVLRIENALGQYEFRTGTLNLNRIEQYGAAARLDAAVKDLGARLVLDVANGNLTLGGAVTAASLTKIGPGVAVLNGTGQLGSAVRVQEGVLAAGTTSAFGAPLGSTHVYLDGGSLELRATGTYSNRLLVERDARLTLAPTATTGTISVSDIVLADVELSLRKSDSFGGSFNVSKEMTVNGTGSAKLDAGVTTQLNVLALNDDVTVSGGSALTIMSLRGAGDLRSTASALTIRGTSSFTGSIEADGGTLTVDTSSSALGGRPITANNNATVVLPYGHVAANSTITLNDSSRLLANTLGALWSTTAVVNDTARVIPVVEGLSDGTVKLAGGVLELPLSGSTDYRGTVLTLADSAIELTGTAASATQSISELRLDDHTLTLRGNAQYTFAGPTMVVDGSGQARIESGVKEVSFQQLRLNEALTLAGEGGYVFANIAGTGSILKEGPGHMKIRGAASANQTGSLTINAGTVTASAYASYRGAITVNAGGALICASNGAVSGTVRVNEGGTIEAGQNSLTNTAIVLAGGTLMPRGNSGITAGGTVNVLSDSIIIAAYTTIGSSSITHSIDTLSLGDHALTVSSQRGSGSAVASFGATFLQIGGTGNARIHNTGGLAFASVTLGDDLTIGGSGRGSLGLYAGAGNLIFEGTGSYTARKSSSSTWTGGLIINGGSVGADASNALAGTHITINPGGTFAPTYSRAAANAVINLMGGTLNPSPSSLTGATINYHSGTILFTGGGTVSVGPGVTLPLRPGVSGAVNLAGGTLELLRENLNSPYDHTIDVSLSADSSIHLNDQVTSSAHQFRINSLSLGDQTLAITTQRATDTLSTVQALKFSGTGKARIDSAINFSIGGTTLNVGLTTGGAGTFTITGVGGSGALTHQGPGDLVFGTNSNSQIAVTINGGTLRLADTWSSFAKGPIAINDGGRMLATSGSSLSGRTVTLGGGTLQLRNDGTFESSHNIAIKASGDSLIDIKPRLGGSAGGSYTFSQLALDSGTLTVANSNNSQVVCNTAVVTGATTLDHQTTAVSYQPADLLRLTQVTLGHALTITGGGKTELRGLSGSGDIIMDGTGRLTIGNSRYSDNRNWTGQVIINSGTLVLSGDTNYNGLGLSPRPFNVPVGATLAVNGIGGIAPGDRTAFTVPITIEGYGDGGAGAIHYGPTADPTRRYDGIIAAPVTLAGPASISVAGLTLNAALHIGDPDGIIAGGALRGVGPLTKTQDSLLHINVPAAYTGGAIIEAGSIVVGQHGSLVGTGSTLVEPGGALAVRKPAGLDPALHSASPQSVELRGGALALETDLDPAPFLSVASTGGSIAIADTARDINFSRLLPGLPGSAWKLGAASRSGGTYTGEIRFDEPTTLVLGGGGGTLTIASGLKAGNNIASLTVDGSGTYVLAGPNDYAGDTTIIAGALHISDVAALGTSTAPILFGGAQETSEAGTLLLKPGMTLPRDVIVRDTAKGAGIGVGTGAEPGETEVAGDIAVYGWLRFRSISDGSSLFVSGTITGSGAIDHTGTGLVRLTANNTFTGPLRIYAESVLDGSENGNRTLGESKAITVHSGGTLRIRSSANYAADAIFTAYASGVVSIASNELPTFSSDSSGVLAIENDAWTAMNSMATLGGGRMFLSSATAGTFAGTSLLPGTGSVYRLGGGGGVLAVANPVLMDAAGASSLTVGTFEVSSQANHAFWSEPGRSGTVILHGDNTYTGSTLVTNGGMLLAGDSRRVLGGSKAITINWNAAVRLLSESNYDPAAKFTVNGILSVAGQFLPPITTTSNGVLAVEVEGYAPLTDLASLGNGQMYLGSMTRGRIDAPIAPGAQNTWRFGGAGGVLTIDADLANAGQTVRSMIIGGSTGGGDGTVVLAGQNTFTGAITVNGDSTLAISGSIVSPIKLQGTGVLQLLSDLELSSIEAGSAKIELGEDATVVVQSMINGAKRTGGGELEIMSYSRTSTGTLQHHGGRTTLRGNAGAAATPAAWAIARLKADVRGGELLFSTSQDLDDLLVDEAAPLARAILGEAVELRLYDNSTGDGLAPARDVIESLWTDIISGYGQGRSGIDLDPGIDHDQFALGLLLARDAKNEPHVLLKALLHGDINGSGIADSADAAILLASYEAATPEAGALWTWLEGDLTFDGLLNEADVSVLASAMNYPFDPASGRDGALDALRGMAGVPEPSAALLALPAMMLLCRRRRLR